MATKKIKQLEKILIAVGIALLAVVIICIVVFSRADKVYDYTMHIDMEKVRQHHEKNPDVVGWVYVNDTPIDYPIVQKDDNAYYIDRDWEGNHSSAGSIFEDFRGKINETENTLLYGHNKSFKEEEWGRQHIYFEVATLEKRYLYRIVASSVLNGEDGAAFDYWNRITLNQEEFQKYIEEIRSTALVWYAPDDDPPTYGDKMIALQTCNSGADDGIRCILFGQCLGEY